jgi:hypothetical protein
MTDPTTCKHPEGWRCAGRGNKAAGLICICACPACDTSCSHPPEARHFDWCNIPSENSENPYFNAIATYCADCGELLKKVRKLETNI